MLQTQWVVLTISPSVLIDNYCLFCKYNAADAIFSGGYQKKNYTVEAYLLKAPTVYLPVYWLKPTTKAVKNKAILLLDDRGKSEAIKEGGLADSLALEGYQVVVPDLSGFGELANGYIKGGDSYVDKVPLNLWFMGMLVNWMKGAGVVNSSFCRKAP